MSVIFLTEAVDLYGMLFSDAGKSVKFPYPGFSNKFGIEKLYYRILHSKKIGEIAPLRSWVRFAIAKSDIKSGDIVIINGITVRSPVWNNEFIVQMKKKKCKVILLMLDSIANLGSDLKEKILSVASLVDAVYTLDSRNAKEMGWYHTYQYYSQINDIEPIGPKTDVFCVMWNGGRLTEAVHIYDYLEIRGITCSFFISGASEEEKEKFKRNGIIYNKWLSYREIVGRISQTKVILDMVRTPESWNTLRPFEACVYNKRLLTNATFICEFPFYRSDYIKRFFSINDIKNIDNDFFVSDQTVNYEYDGRFSPLLLLDQIQKEISRNEL